MSKITESLMMNILSVKFSCMGGTIDSIIQKLDALSRKQRVCLVVGFADFLCSFFTRRQARLSLARNGAHYRQALFDAKRSLQGENRCSFLSHALRQLTLHRQYLGCGDTFESIRHDVVAMQIVPKLGCHAYCSGACTLAMFEVNHEVLQRVGINLNVVMT